jgi:acylphosphatase
VEQAARRFFVSGRVQGVGYRNFAQRAAAELGIAGWAKNLADGRVEVYAAGDAASLADFAGRLSQGPRWADVRHVEEQEAAVDRVRGFAIR